MTNLADIIKLANWAAEETRKNVPYSSNIPESEEPSSHRKIQMRLTRRRAEKPHEKKLLQEIFDWNLDLSSVEERYPLFVSEVKLKSLDNKSIPFRRLADEITNKTYDLKSKTRSDLRLIETIVTKALKFGIGNCRECSAYAMMLLLEYPQQGLPGLPKIDSQIRLERIALKNDDHAIVILNRDPKTNLSNITTWNDDTVICDPWLKKVYTKKEIFEKPEEERNAILKDFAIIIKTELTRERDYFVGENYNQQIHSDDWIKKHTGEKYWRPKRLIDAERPPRKEKLPELSTPSFAEVMNSKDIEKVFNRFDGRAKINSYSGVYNQLELQTQFQTLAETLKNPKPYKLPVNIHFENPKYNVDVIYHNDAWILIDKKRNKETLYRMEHPQDAANKLFEIFTDGKTTTDAFVAFSADVFKTRVDKKQLNERLQSWSILTKWKDGIDDRDIIKRVDASGFSWLHVAAQKDDTETVNKLLQNGADTKIISKTYKTALDVAIEESSSQVVNLLMKR